MTTILRVNLVLSIDHTQVQTDRYGVLICTDPDLRRDLTFYFARQLPASLAFDELTREVSVVGSAPVDRLLAVSTIEHGADRVSVQLMKRPTLMYLSLANPRFEEMNSLMQAAIDRKQAVAIGVLPGGQTIEDARMDDWQR